MAILRQLAAMCFAATLAWDYCARNDELFGFFSSWSLFLQFIYFQLPIKSRALCFVHSLAFVCSITVPLGYLYSLLWNPLIELNHALEWEVSYSTVIIRSILVHFVPMFFHAIDITSNQDHLIGSYHLQPRRLMMLWSILSYAFVTFIFEFFNPKNNSDEIVNSSESSSEDQADGSNAANSNNMMGTELPSRGLSRLLVPTLFFLFGFFLLIMLIMRSAYSSSYRRKLSINLSSSSSSSSSSSQPLSESARGTGATTVGNGSGNARSNSISNLNNNSTSQRHHGSINNNSAAGNGSSKGLAISTTTTSTASSVSMRKTATTTTHHPSQ